MPSRPDIRDLATNVRDAFADADRETLLDVLTFVVKEYVVEGPPPMMIHQTERLADLQGASFAQVIAALQTRFDHPELAMFVVDGEQVSVRIGGVVHPLTGQRAPMVASAAELPRPQAGVRVVETTLAQRPPSAPASGGAPPAPRGLSIRGQPGPGPAATAAPTPPPAPTTSTPVTPSSAPTPPPSATPTPPASDSKPEPTSGDDASARFSLLELD